MGPKKGFVPALAPLEKKNDREDKMNELLTLLKRQPINYSDIEKIRELGQGQYGTVFLVRHKSTQQMMAMKQIQFALDEVGLKQIKTELDVLLRSQSPHIVKFFGSFLQEGFVYYCMEFMEFGSLEKLYKGGVPEPVLAKIATSMIKGLKFLQDELRVIHRDVKPTNVLINHDGEIKLCDFGVSGTLVQSVAKTYTGCSFYMAPERIDTTNTASQYDVRSDVWSLGISLVEMGNGEPPFEQNPSVFALLNRIVNGDPPKLKPTFSKEAHDFIAKCLERDFNKRPSYARLLDHPWIARSLGEELDIASFFATRSQQA